MSASPLTRSELDGLLGRTSRTFALAIPLLASPVAEAVGLAYLVFRIADTLEDAPRWGRDRRAEALAELDAWLDRGGAAPGAWTESTPDSGCLELIARSASVHASVVGAGEPTAKAIFAAARRTARGMADFVARQDERGGLALRDVADLRAYCYVVAGIVGELLTELFALHDARAAAVRAELDARAATFGEGLQLVNILKDTGADLAEGRAYLPPGVPRAVVFELARADLSQAKGYVAALTASEVGSGVVAFCELPRRLAEATLDRLETGGAKLGREDVLALYREVTVA